MSYHQRGTNFFIVLDSLNNFTVLERDLSVKSYIKTSDDPEEITSFARQGTALIFTRGNQVGFIEANQGKIGPVQCAANHDIKLVSAQMDYATSIWLYAADPTEGQIYVFRTSNLLNVPVATSCELETKMPLRQTELLSSGSADLKMKLQTLRGGLLVSFDDEERHGELTYYNTTQFSI